MPWSKSNLPDAAKNLTSHQKEVFVRVANSMLDDGKSEEAAIRGGIAQAKKTSEDTKKGLSDVIAEAIEKYFGGSHESDYQPDSEGYQSIAKSIDEEEREFTAVVLRPDVPDLHGDIYDADVVKEAAHNYMRFCRKANLQHLVETELASVVESSIAHSDYQLGEGEVKKGDWIMTMKVHDDELWQMCKDGTFTGFSVGCMASTEALDDET